MTETMSYAEPGNVPTLYFMPGTCALGVHIALEWAGAPYELREVRREDLRSPAYLALNPTGVVPALTIDGRTLTEASATLLALARRFPVLGPGPESDEQMRFEFERLIIFIGGTLHPHFWPWFVPSRYGAHTAEAGADVKAAAEALIAKDLTLLDRRLAAGPFLLGEHRTAADAYLFPMARWGYGLAKPTSAYPNIHGLMQRLHDDPGVDAALRAEGLS